jgi:hypothetical protein
MWTTYMDTLHTEHAEKYIRYNLRCGRGKQETQNERDNLGKHYYRPQLTL